MKNLLISILIIGTIALSGWLYISLGEVNQLARNNQQLENTIGNFQIVRSQKLDVAVRDFFHSQLDFNRVEVSNLINQDTLITLPKESNKLYLIAYFDSRMCSVCLEREWSNFDWLHKEFSQNFILLTKGYPNMYFNQNDRFRTIRDEIYIVKNDIIDLVDSPIYFL